MSRFWVGGATGFLGSHLVGRLVEQGHDVVAVSRGGGRVHGASVMCVDVLDADAVERSARGCDGAFVATGKVSRRREDAEELHRLNVQATRRALRALRRAAVPRVVYVSTSGTIAVGTDPNGVFDESAAPPLDIITTFPYYRSKYYAELEALEANSPELQVVIVNPSLLLGPGDMRGSSTEDVKNFLERSIPAVPAGGISFVDVRDVADAMIGAFERGRPGERYLLGGQNLTIAAFFARLERITGVRAPRLTMPRSPKMAIGASRLFSRVVRAIGAEPPVEPVSVEMGQYFWYCDSSKAEREIGFTPRDPGQTLRDTVDDLVDRGAAFPRVDSARAV